MAIALVNTWKEKGCNYEEGVAIYLRLGKSETLKNLFRHGKTIYTERKLREVLQDLPGAKTPKQDDAKRAAAESQADLHRSRASANTQSDSSSQSSSAFKTFTHSKNLKYSTTLFPEDLRKLDIQKGQLYAEASFLHKRLDTITDPEQGIKTLGRIKAIMKDIIPGIWEQLDFYHLTGERLVMEDTADKKSLPELIRARNNARTSVSKYKGNPNKETQYKKWQAKLERLEYAIENFEG